jgi:hypothetical protein
VVDGYDFYYGYGYGSGGYDYYGSEVGADLKSVATMGRALVGLGATLT